MRERLVVGMVNLWFTLEREEYYRLKWGNRWRIAKYLQFPEDSRDSGDHPAIRALLNGLIDD